MSVSDAQRATLRIVHMLDAIAGIRQIVTGNTAAAIGADWTRSRALERGFEIISEASRHIPEAQKDLEPDVPWRQVAGLGNVLRHDYDGIDVTLLLVSAANDLPDLKEALERILTRLED